jgi:hypothetical protein
MTIEAEMVVPREAIDDLGQLAKASATFLRYTIELAYRTGGALDSSGTLEIRREQLVHVRQNEAARQLQFPRQGG